MTLRTGFLDDYRNQLKRSSKSCFSFYSFILSSRSIRTWTIRSSCSFSLWVVCMAIHGLRKFGRVLLFKAFTFRSIGWMLPKVFEQRMYKRSVDPNSPKIFQPFWRKLNLVKFLQFFFSASFPRARSATWIWLIFFSLSIFNYTLLKHHDFQSSTTSWENTSRRSGPMVPFCQGGRTRNKFFWPVL